MQSRTRLSLSVKQKQNHAGVKHLEYVSKNTYLCQYQDGDLEKIRQLGLIIYVDVYQTQFKIALHLKEAMNPDQIYENDIVFHAGVDTKSENLHNNIVGNSHCDVKDIDFLPNKARLTIQTLYLNAVASIDDVRYIEAVGKVVECNYVARQILNFDSLPSTRTKSRLALQGKVVSSKESFGRRKKHTYIINNLSMGEKKKTFFGLFILNNYHN